MTEQVDGHVTHALNLRRYLARRADVVAHWFPTADAKSDLWSRVTAPGLRMGLRARDAMRDGRAKQCDAILAHTQNILLFAPDLMRSLPTVISTDASPLGFHELAHAYRHEIHAKWVEAAKRVWNRQVFHAAAKIVSMSDWATRGLMEHYGVAADKIETVPVSVDTNLWKPSDESRPRDGVVRFLFVGGDFKRKGGDLLVKWAEVTTAKNWEIHFVTRTAVPMPRGVHVHRFDNNSHGLVALAQKCDAFVLPTRGDTSSFASVEAMAAGLPVITTRVGGVAELVVNEETGFVIAANDFDALNDRMTRLIQSPSLRRSMGAAARRRAVAHYDVTKNCKRIIDLMTQLSTPRAH
jgi:glycosyltransferase involved in cell wall biosynthesis